MNRRYFLASTGLSIPLLGSGALLLPMQTGAQDTMKPAKPVQLPPKLVKESVRVGHNNLPEVQRMLKEQPGLLNASWDVGGGELETALEGAGHVGNREIAESLIRQGARANIFVLTMLGHTAIMKELLSLYTHLLRSKGPHGLTLMHHATRGVEPAMELLEHFQGLGLTEMKLAMP